MLEEAFDIGFRNRRIAIKKTKVLQPVVGCGFQPESGVLVGNRKNGIGKRRKPLDL
jgi:hypothetical protein